jgi:hypothetical protein
VEYFFAEALRAKRRGRKKKSSKVEAGKFVIKCEAKAETSL